MEISEIYLNNGRNQAKQFYLEYLNNHTYYNTKSMTKEFINTKLSISNGSTLFKELYNKLNKKFARCTYKAKQNNLIEKYNSHCYIILKHNITPEDLI